jgi:DNA-binding winged helix-turn-helix (wHTH) protein/predicted ATPase
VDVCDERLWRGEEAIHLTNKAFAVLRYLVEHPARLVTKDALFDVVWADTVVSEAALSVCIRELRQALGDDARAPQFIETVRGRGYRFIAPVTIVGRSPAAPQADAPGRPCARSASSSGRSFIRGLVPLVGREAELVQLHRWFATALTGDRRVGFITGEAGIGKTTLVDAFVADVGNKEGLWIGHGQCVDQYGAGEAYLPVLEALGRMCRGPEGEPLEALLRQHAPSWLVQMPALLSVAERSALERSASGATQARMLRELAEAIELLTAERPLVLVLEDLHWSDASTLAWLGYVARRREAARLLVLATYRPVEAIVADHPLRALAQELRRHEQCTELVLDYLSQAAVADYLTKRCLGHGLPVGLARRIHQRTDGNPLFVVTLVDTLVRQGALEVGAAGWSLPRGLETVDVGVPESLRQLIEQQLEQVSPEDQAILEAASVVGMEFSAAAAAAGVEGAPEAVEARCAALAGRGQFLRARGTAPWPDGTIAARYGFIHALYPEVLYHRVPAGQRVRLHREIGGRLEAGFGGQVREIAAELALHFVRGRDTQRAVQYLRYAGENAWRRSAYQEAVTHLTQGLELLPNLPDAAERTQQELDLQMILGPSLMATKGHGDPDVEHAYTRARTLCQQIGETPQRFPVLWGLWRFYNVREALQTARELGEELLSLAQRENDPIRLPVAHQALGHTLFFLGALGSARTHLEQGIALADPSQHRALAVSYGIAPGVMSLTHAAWALWMLGYPDQALERSQEACALTLELGHPQSLAYALFTKAILHVYRREADADNALADTVVTLATEQGFALWVAVGTALKGWARVAREHSTEGLEQLREGSTDALATGAALLRVTFLTVLAEAYGRMGQIDEGLCTLAEALAAVEEGGQRPHEAELHRLQGELLQRQANPDAPQAEACFHQSLAVARRQQARSWELRAATSLSGLWQQQGKRDEARKLLAEIYGWFTEGFDTADLKDAKALLEQLEA